LEANNYDSLADYDNGSCTYDTTVNGCTDPNASNYNSLATIDDGSCAYDSIFGCTDMAANNYDSLADYDNGSCTYPDTTTNNVISYGCTDVYATNYNANALYDNGSCTYSQAHTDTASIGGCTDGTALNYATSATYDNGTCVFTQDTVINFTDSSLIATTTKLTTTTVVTTSLDLTKLIDAALVNSSLIVGDSLVVTWSIQQAGNSSEFIISYFINGLNLSKDGILVILSLSNPSAVRTSKRGVDKRTLIAYVKVKEIVVTGFVPSIHKEVVACYPNPFVDMVSFESPDVSTVSVYSTTGELLISTNVESGSIDLGELESGAYIINIYDKEANLISVEKIVK
jgi:hypothetical protein